MTYLHYPKKDLTLANRENEVFSQGTIEINCSEWKYSVLFQFIVYRMQQSHNQTRGSPSSVFLFFKYFYLQYFI